MNPVFSESFADGGVVGLWCVGGSVSTCGNKSAVPRISRPCLPSGMGFAENGLHKSAVGQIRAVCPFCLLRGESRRRDSGTHPFETNNTVRYEAGFRCIFCSRRRSKLKLVYSHGFYLRKQDCLRVYAGRLLVRWAKIHRKPTSYLFGLSTSGRLARGAVCPLWLLRGER